jgi:adenylate cyclase class IV
MPDHRRTNREIEVKLRVADVPDTLCKLKNLGARYESRVLERNTLYDTPDSDFRRRGNLLRVRVEKPAKRPGTSEGRRHAGRASTRTILTSKFTAAPRSARARRYKEKLERELVVPSSPAHCDRVFRSLGLRRGFRYDKFRSTFRLSRLPGLTIELDETPAGTFLELEGRPRAIDSAARALGYTPRDYFCGTYWDVYVAECRRCGLVPRNMVFDK